MFILLKKKETAAPFGAEKLQTHMQKNLNRSVSLALHKKKKNQLTMCQRPSCKTWDTEIARGKHT